jgi:hypothetical protein
MTDRTELREAYRIFRAMPYPDHPRTEALRDWNSGLLTLDGHIAGYAGRVAEGSLAPREVPEADSLAQEVGTFGQELEDLRPSLPEEADLVDEYRTYVAALHRVIRALAALAGPEDEHPAP